MPEAQLVTAQFTENFDLCLLVSSLSTAIILNIYEGWSLPHKNHPNKAPQLRTNAVLTNVPSFRQDVKHWPKSAYKISFRS